MSTNTIGVNLYSVRQHCQNTDDLDRTLQRIAAIGYPSVQISGVGPIAPKEIAEMLDRHSLTACATHERLEMLVENVGEVINKMRTVGAPFTALGYPGESYFRPNGAAELAEVLNAPATALAEAGLRFGYHNHEWEFERFGAKSERIRKTFFEEFLEATAALPIIVELDVHWVVRGGGSPARFIRDWANRMGPMHIKDFAVDGREPVFAEVGEGNLDWDAILPAAAEAGIDTFIVEQDEARVGRDIFDSLEISLENMGKMGLV